MATRSFDYDAIWLKAITFINRALDDTDDFEERAFWAACSLELLGKAALTKVNPALIVGSECYWRTTMSLPAAFAGFWSK
jgi:hypothetical protein